MKRKLEGFNIVDYQYTDETPQDEVEFYAVCILIAAIFGLICFLSFVGFVFYKLFTNI